MWGWICVRGRKLRTWAIKICYVSSLWHSPMRIRLVAEHENTPQKNWQNFNDPSHFSASISCITNSRKPNVLGFRLVLGLEIVTKLLEFGNDIKKYDLYVKGTNLALWETWSSKHRYANIILVALCLWLVQIESSIEFWI